MMDTPQILKLVQEAFPEKIIKGILACKGTERTMAPPNDLTSKEAPFRRSIMKLRSTGKITIDDWEKYDELAKRKVIRKSQPCRVNITVFAANPIQTHQPSGDQASVMPPCEPTVAPQSLPESLDSPLDSEVGRENLKEDAVEPGDFHNSEDQMKPNLTEDMPQPLKAKRRQIKMAAQPEATDFWHCRRKNKPCCGGHIKICATLGLNNSARYSECRELALKYPRQCST